jgi:hypothetical protein
MKMLETKTLTAKVRFLGPIRRKRYRRYFIKYLMKNHPNGLECNGLVFKVEVDLGFDVAGKCKLVVREKEINRLLYNNGCFGRWTKPLRRSLRHFIYAQGWAYYIQLKEETTKRAVSIKANFS